MNFWTGVGIGAGGTFVLFAAGIYVLYRKRGVKKPLH